MSCKILKKGFDTGLLLAEVDRLSRFYVEKKQIDPVTAEELPLTRIRKFKRVRGWTGIPLRNARRASGPLGLDSKGVQRENLREPCLDTEAFTGCPYMQQIVLDIEQEFETRVAVTRLYKLEAGGYIPPHSDADATDRTYVDQIHRLCIPIATSDGVHTTIAGRSYLLECGTLYYMDVGKPHSIRNLSANDRINFYIDVRPTEKLKARIGAAADAPKHPQARADLAGALERLRFTLNWRRLFS